MSISNRLKNISLFRSIKDKDELLIKLEEIIQEKSFSEGTYIIKEGEIGKSMYILAEGTVSIERTTLMGDAFNIANLSEDKNVFFGELALLDNDVRSASVYAVTESLCYMIEKSAFTKFCENNPYIGYAIIKDIAISLAAKLRKTTNDNLTLINTLCCEEF